jgi:hypothetical protein
MVNAREKVITGQKPATEELDLFISKTEFQKFDLPVSDY